jgi:hypothetical protein
MISNYKKLTKQASERWNRTKVKNISRKAAKAQRESLKGRRKSKKITGAFLCGLATLRENWFLVLPQHLTQI